MKKVALSFSILALAALFTLIGCKKDANVAPEPDKELASSLDISYALMQVTDIEQICAFVGENNQPPPKFYMPNANTTTTVYPSNDTMQKYLKVAFNKTECLDGRLRSGTIFMNYQSGNLNSTYYHDYKFAGQISLSAYSVDNFNITVTGGPLQVKNLVTPVGYSPATTNLSWSFTGQLAFKDPDDSTHDMQINFDLVKTLVNTSTPTVFPVNKLAAINWSLGIVSYKGTVSGFTSRNVPFKYQIDDSYPVTRNFTCSPDKIYGVALSTNTVTAGRVSEFHPFINGSASFTTAALYPRVIHYGPEVPVGIADAPCDNSGAVTIKGISYPVDFKKSYK